MTQKMIIGPENLEVAESNDEQPSPEVTLIVSESGLWQSHLARDFFFGAPTTEMDELFSYLVANTRPGDEITVDVTPDQGREKLKVTLSNLAD